MKIIVQWNGLPTAENYVIERFMKTGSQSPECVKLVGRWHRPVLAAIACCLRFTDTQPLAAVCRLYTA
ncbi:hypothetical protein P3T40_007926 [Paraburkholderia sp. EB58]|jgi:hypothetical protein|uniref:DUF3303 domain-containing protein n=1 Tax=Paraburkholderia sp. EB58 TaxID=3035125 RepID=UPI003D1CFFD8